MPAVKPKPSQRRRLPRRTRSSHRPCATSACASTPNAESGAGAAAARTSPALLASEAKGLLPRRWRRRKPASGVSARVIAGEPIPRGVDVSARQIVRAARSQLAWALAKAGRRICDAKGNAVVLDPHGRAVPHSPLLRFAGPITEPATQVVGDLDVTYLHDPRALTAGQLIAGGRVSSEVVCVRFRPAIGRQRHAKFVHPLGGFSDAHVCVCLYRTCPGEVDLDVDGLGITLSHCAFEVATPRGGLMGGALGVGEIGLGARKLTLHERPRRVPNDPFESIHLGAQLVRGHRGQILAVNGVEGTSLRLAALRLQPEVLESVGKDLITRVEIELALAVWVGEVETQLVARAAGRCRDPLPVKPRRAQHEGPVRSGALVDVAGGGVAVDQARLLAHPVCIEVLARQGDDTVAGFAHPDDQALLRDVDAL